MPPRLSKRQQREQEELVALSSVAENAQTLPTATSGDRHLEASEEDNGGDSAEIVPKKTTKPVSSGFSLLASDGAHDESGDEEEDEETKSIKKKNKKKKKKGGSIQPLPPPKPVTKGEKSIGKKGKGKANQEDDLDRALAELSLKYSDITIPDPSSDQRAAPSVVSALHTLSSLLSIQPKYLDADAEMRRFFGSGVIRSAEASSSSTPTQRIPAARSTLCKPQSTWPPGATRDGLAMRPLTNEERKDVPQENNWMTMPGDKWFTIEHSPSYRWDQAQFIQVVGMLDPNNLFALMRESYWHVDTLLQIAEIYRAQDERRGTMRTAFEFARLLWALDPWTDPHLALAHLDFLSVKAEQYEWFLETESAWEEIAPGRSFAKSLKSLPGWLWSKALVLRGLGSKRGGGEAKATEALRQAIVDFPEVLVTLNSLVGVNVPPSSKLPQSISRWNASYSSSSAISLLCQIYAHRSVSLWKIPENLSWLNATLQSVATQIKPTTDPDKHSLGDSTSFVDAVIRHAIVSDLKALSPFIGSILASIGPQEAYDIVTPKVPGTTVYDVEYLSLANAESARKRREAQTQGQGRRGARNNTAGVDPVEFLQGLEALLTLEPGDRTREQLLRGLQDQRSNGIVRQMERWTRAHPELAQQFPNARAYLQMPPAERPRPVAEGENHEAPAGPAVVPPPIAPMPGAFTGDAIEEQMLEEHDDPEEADGSGNEEGAPILPVRIARGIMGLFAWGNRVQVDDETDSEEDADAEAEEDAQR
ncbi:hypothetical protein FRC17_001323 [Serendipita sp. 399]|nr:hypothetical protein FRC17_001323 [Serendipita sp. 399]